MHIKKFYLPTWDLRHGHLIYIDMRGLRGVLYEGLTGEDSSITEENSHVLGNRLNIWYRKKHTDSNEIFSLIFN